MRSIRWKLIAAFLLVVFVPLYLVNRYGLDFFDRYTRAALENEMVAYALIAGEQYRTMVFCAAEEEKSGVELIYADLLSSYGPEIQSRIRIISPEGIVLFDSHDDSTVGSDFSNRPEVVRSLSGKYGARSALTDDGKFLYYYVALPITDADGKVLAVAYVSRHTGPIIRALKEMKSQQRRALFLAVAAAFLTAVVLALTITRRLRRLTRATRDFAEGTAPMEVRIGGKDEIGELARSVKRMAEEIDRRNRYNRDFLSETTHELKAPLTAIKGAVEILEQGAAEKPASRDKFISNIRHDVERMIRLVGELTRLTQLDVDVLSEKKEPVEYCTFLRQLVERVRAARAGQNPPLTVSVPDGAYTVSMIPHRIEQVINNLLENAFRYTPPAGTVELGLREGPDQTVVTSVRDTGPGIAPANVEKIFDRFFTTEPKDREKAYGSGLGLAIARSIIENHGGRIWVESTSNRGATFFFSLSIS